MRYKIISLVTATLVVFLTVASFRLSYAALSKLAAVNGIEPGLAWLWPLIVDGALIVFSMAVLRGSLHGEKTVYPWVMVALFSALSIGFNVLHAPETWVAQVIAAVPPVALLLSFEALMNQVRAEIRHATTLQSLDQLSQAAQAKRDELELLNRQIISASCRKDKVQDSAPGSQAQGMVLNGAFSSANGPKDSSGGRATFIPGDLKALERANQTRQEQITARQTQVLALTDQAWTQRDVAEALEVSVSTIKRDLKELNGRRSASRC